MLKARAGLSLLVLFSDKTDMVVAIIIPCYNEELTIEKVVRDCRQSMPNADIYVFDNNSKDQTKTLAQKAGATVISSPLQGKGHVVRHAFSKVRADYYVMLDGDDTYPAEQIPFLINKAIEGGFEMVVGTRLSRFSDTAFRGFHLLGNKVFSGLVSLLFQQKISDMLSGFRVFTADFVQNVPLHSKGFEVETDLTLQAISRGFSVGEFPISYRHRPEGSFSKLRTYQDGFQILQFIAKIVKDYKPLPFFMGLSVFAFVLALFVGWAPVKDFIDHAYVYTVPRAILAASLMILSTVLCGVGLILDSQIRYFQDQMQVLRRMRSNEIPPAQKKAA